LEKSFTIDLSGSKLDLFHLYTKFKSSYQRPVYLDTDIKTKDKDHAYYIHPDQYILSDPWYYTDMKDVKRAKKEDMKKVVILCDTLKELKVNDNLSSLKL
jgi:hypothetical protein